jgi:hypothetical protein
MAKGTEYPFLQRKYINKYMNWCSTSLMIREIKIKTSVRYHLTPIRMVIIKKTKQRKGLYTL